MISKLEAKKQLSGLLGEEEVLLEESVRGSSQKQLSLKIDEKDHEKLLDDTESSREKARLHSVQLAHSGDWLNVVPSPSLGLQLHPPEFRVCVLYRLGMQIFDSDGTCAGCSQPGSDRLGDHAVSCASQGERIAWHNYLRDALYNTAVSAHLAPLKEERALLPGGVRPADVLLPNFAAGGRHMAVDVCVVSSLQAQLVDKAAAEPGAAL